MPESAARQCDAFPSIWHDMPLDALLVLQIGRHSDAYASSPWSTLALELAATRHEVDSSRSLPVTAGSCRGPCEHRPPITCRLDRFPSQTSLALALASKPCPAHAASGFQFAFPWFVLL